MPDHICVNSHRFSSFVIERICPLCFTPNVMLIQPSAFGPPTLIPVNFVYSNAPSAPSLHMQTMSQGFMHQNPQFSPPPQQPQPLFVPPQSQVQQKMSIQNLLSPSSSGPPSFPNAFQSQPQPSPQIQTFTIPNFQPPTQPPQQQFTFINLSPASVAASAQFTPSGNIDPNSLPSGFPNSRFSAYVDRIHASAYNTPLSGHDMHSLSNESAPSPSDVQWNSQYAGAAFGLSGQQKAAKFGPDRAIHHAIKSADKLSSHLRDLGNARDGATTDAQKTETGGEAATTRYLQRRGYALKLGFMKGAGVDQIWVKRDNNGTITEYAIVEAKGWGVGGQPATLGTTADKGFQMSARWTYLSALALATTKTNTHVNSTGRKLLEAIEKNTGVLVWGVCVTEQADRNQVYVADCGVYNVSPPQSAGNNLNYWSKPLG